MVRVGGAIERARGFGLQPSENGLTLPPGLGDGLVRPVEPLSGLVNISAATSDRLLLRRERVLGGELAMDRGGQSLAVVCYGRGLDGLFLFERGGHGSREPDPAGAKLA